MSDPQPPPLDSDRWAALGRCPECGARMTDEGATGERLGLHFHCPAHGRFRYNWDLDRLERDPEG